MGEMSVLLVNTQSIEKLNQAGVAVCNYYDLSEQLVQGIGIEHSDDFPELPLIRVKVPVSSI